MKSKIYFLNRISFFVFLIICITIPILMLVIFKSILVFIISLMFSVIISSSFFIYVNTLKKDNQNIYIEVSRMLEQVLNETYEMNFSDKEDSLLSKLQYQVLKLRNVFTKQAQKATEDQEEIKSLISDIAHQLKTPLANVKVYGDLLKDETLTREQISEFIVDLSNQVEKLSFLTDSLIKMSRLEGGVIRLNMVYGNLNETILIAVKQVFQSSKKKNIIINLEKNEKIYLYHDLRWTTEAIFNVLDNAVKYTLEKGKINIRIIAYEMFARIDIEDNGIGIDQSEINKIFKRFYRGIGSDNTDGIGIGLYLTREIISMQRGYLKVYSSDKGSIFSIFLPLKFIK